MYFWGSYNSYSLWCLPHSPLLLPPPSACKHVCIAVYQRCVLTHTHHDSCFPPVLLCRYPSQVALPPAASGVSVCAGYDHACAVTNAGDVYVFIVLTRLKTVTLSRLQLLLGQEHGEPVRQQRLRLCGSSQPLKSASNNACTPLQRVHQSIGDTRMNCLCVRPLTAPGADARAHARAHARCCRLLV